MDTTRRDLIRIAAAAVAAGPLTAATTPGSTPKFFSQHEFQLVDELTELIIPADEHSPGAREAKVAAYIDFRLADDVDLEARTAWRDGLKLIDQLCQQWHKASFLNAAPEDRISLLERISKNEHKPKKPEEFFFRELKAKTARTYYMSSIGIHKDLNYQGNRMLKEFVGIDAATVPVHVPEIK